MTARRLALLIVLVGGVALAIALARAPATTTYEAAGPISVVDVETDEGGVELVGTTSDGTLRAERTAGRWGQARFEQSARDGVVVLRAECPGWALLGCGASYRLTVPEGAQVRVRTGGGAIGVAARLTGPVRLETGSGDVTVAAVAGVLTVRTTSGAISALGLEADSIDVTSGSGPVDVAVVGAPPSVVIAETASGSLALTLPPAEYRVVADSRGTVDIGVVNVIAGRSVVAARSDTGSITIRPSTPAASTTPVVPS